ADSRHLMRSERVASRFDVGCLHIAFATTGAISPESTGRGAGAGRGNPNERRRKGGHPPVDAGAAGEADPGGRSNRLCASLQLRPKDHPAPGLPGVYPSAVSAADPSVLTAICEHLVLLPVR